MKRLILIGLLVHGASPSGHIESPWQIGQASRLSSLNILPATEETDNLLSCGSGLPAAIVPARSRPEGHFHKNRKKMRVADLLLNLLAPTDCSAADNPRPNRLLTAPESLLPNGDFERADPRDSTKPAFWDKPDGLGVQWTNAPGRPGKAIRVNTAVSEQAMVAQWRKMGITQWDIPNPAGNPVSDTYGLSYYSDAIAVKSGQTYRVSFDYKGASGGAKVWVRGWGFFAGEKRRRWETIVNCRTKNDDWTHFEQDFHPTQFRPEVTEMKVMLYAYYPPGVYWFTNVKIEPVDESGR